MTVFGLPESEAVFLPVKTNAITRKTLRSHFFSRPKCCKGKNGQIRACNIAEIGLRRWLQPLCEWRSRGERRARAACERRGDGWRSSLSDDCLRRLISIRTPRCADRVGLLSRAKEERLLRRHPRRCVLACSCRSKTLFPRLLVRDSDEVSCGISLASWRGGCWHSVCTSRRGARPSRTRARGTRCPTATRARARRRRGGRSSPTAHAAWRWEHAASARSRRCSCPQR